MCFGELGVVVERAGDAVSVRTDRGLLDASVLLAPQAAPGDHVVVHSGHVVEVVSGDRAAVATDLRTAMGGAGGRRADQAPP